MTVKTQGGKAITKDGKVSCGCCFACGLYDSFAWYDEKLTYEDYPDEIEIEVQLEELYSAIMTKSLQGIDIVYGGTILGDPISLLSIDNRGLGPLINEIESWSFAIPGQQLSAPSTLFSDYITDTPGFASITKVRTTFGSSYTISGPISGTVTETGLSQIAFDGFLNEDYYQIIDYCGEYLGEGLRLIFNRRIHKWTVNGNAKSGLQNTPVGSYAGGYTVS